MRESPPSAILDFLENTMFAGTLRITKTPRSPETFLNHLCC